MSDQPGYDRSASEEVARLRRQLRASTAVNRQLHAQLDAHGARPTPTQPPRRAADLLTSAEPARAARTIRRDSVGGRWLEQLAHTHATQEPYMVHNRPGPVFVIEGRHRRRIRAGWLALALEPHLGAPLDVDEATLETFLEGVPIEALEAPTGPPFIVVGGQRLPLRGLPVTHPVDEQAAESIPAGPTLTLPPRDTARTQPPHRLNGHYLLNRVRRARERHGGIVPALNALVRKISRRLRQ